MIALVQSLPVGNALRVFLAPPEGALWWRLLRRSSDAFTGPADAGAVVVVDNSVDDVVLDTTALVNGNSYVYRLFSWDGAAFTISDPATAIPATSYQPAGPSPQQIVRDRVDLGMRVEVAAGRLKPDGGKISVITAPFVLADKTYTAAAFCLDQSRLPAAVVCQVHIQEQWARVIGAFTTLRAYEVIKGTPYDLPEADVYVFRYSQLAGWTDVFATGMFRSVIYDEPQELRTGLKSQKGQGAKVLTEHATYRLGLTATPIYNYGSEIFNVMGFIRPGVLGGWDDFQREYCADDKRLKDPKALGTFLREQYAFLRRTKGDVGKEMPAVNRIVDLVDYDQKAVDSVEDMARHLAIKATTGSFVERGNAARDLDILLRLTTGVAKAKAVANMVRIIVEGGEPVVLMGWHRDVYDIWLDRLKDLNPAMYTGSETGGKKVRSKEDFVAGRTNLLIMSLRSAAGLDGLQYRCSTMVFGELDWSPGIHHQCIERLDREGQTKPVTALFLVADDGSDPPMMEMLGLKASEAHHVVDPLTGAPVSHSDGSRLKVLVDRYLSRGGAA